MSSILNITNGDNAVELMAEAGIAGEYLPWRDVLHEGPVPAGLSLSDLSAKRADYIASCGWAPLEQVQQGFSQRDALLDSSLAYQRIVLWFEHDLYDQLQLLQILDYYAEAPPRAELSLICVDKYLGLQTPQALTRLVRYEQTVTAEQLTLAQTAWQAFREADPIKWAGLLERDLSALPFLRSAILRMLQEFPSCANGLSRSQLQILRGLAQGINKPGKLFVHCGEQEQAMFMGDSSFERIVLDLINAKHALLSLVNPELKLFDPQQRLQLTELGQQVLAGKQHWLDLHAGRWWLGGTKLKPGKYWCWDEQTKVVSRFSECPRCAEIVPHQK